MLGSMNAIALLELEPMGSIGIRRFGGNGGDGGTKSEGISRSVPPSSPPSENVMPVRRKIRSASLR
jgi:hypothetical protein